MEIHGPGGHHLHHHHDTTSTVVVVDMGASEEDCSHHHRQDGQDPKDDDGPPPCYFEASDAALPTYAEAINGIPSAIPTQSQSSRGWRDSISSTVPLTTTTIPLYGGRRTEIHVQKKRRAAGGCFFLVFFIFLIFSGSLRRLSAPSDPYVVRKVEPSSYETYSSIDWDRLFATPKPYYFNSNRSSFDNDFFDRMFNDSVKYPTVLKAN